MAGIAKFVGAASVALLFALPASSAGAQSGSAAGDGQRPRAQDSERRICRSEVETGSLARRRRRCFTRAEWDQLARAARENTQYEMDRSMARPGGGE